MILTDDFVFIHLPKTAGTFVSHILSRVYGEENSQDVMKHGTCSDIPQSHAGKPIVSTLRNPYERYVSQYRFQWWKLHPDQFCGEEEMRRAFPHYPDLSFADYLDLTRKFQGVHRGQPTGFENDNFPPEESLGWHTEQFVRFFFKHPKRVFAQIDEQYLAQEKYKEALLEVRFLDMENVNRELHSLLLEYGHSPVNIDFILSMGKILPAEGGRKKGDRWEDYYTPELKQWVRTRERMLFQIFPQFDR